MNFENIEWSPSEYKKAAIIAEESGKELLSRLDFMSIQPKTIIDMGAGAGQFSAALKKKYQQASVYAYDLSLAMLQAHETSGYQMFCGDAEHLPFKNQSIDLIFANLLLPWHSNSQILFKEWKRVLKPNGLLLFSSLGLDTLKEWQTILCEKTTPIFMDMHDLGDALLHVGLADPVLDVDYFVLSYQNKNRLVHELLASGMWFPSQDEEKSKHFPEPKPWEVTYEIIYGHAFGPINPKPNSSQEIKISMGELRKQLNKNT